MNPLQQGTGGRKSRGGIEWVCLGIFCAFSWLGFGVMHPKAEAQTGSAPWKAVESDGIVFFILLEGENRIERYDLASGSWLPAIAVTPPAGSSLNTGWVDGDGIYLAMGKTLVRYDRNGGGGAILLNTMWDLTTVIADDHFIFASYHDHYVSLDKSNNAVIDQQEFQQDIYGISIAPGFRSLYGRNDDGFPGEIYRVTYNGDGSFGSQTDSPYFGVFPAAGKTFVFPGEDRIVDGAGIVYNTALGYVNSLAGNVDDIRWVGNEPVVLRGNRLVAYSVDLFETASAELPVEAESIALRGNQVVAFSPDPVGSRGIRVDEVALADLSPETGTPVDPVGLPFTPDDILMDSGGVLYLLSRAYRSLFRWDTHTRSFLSTIPLAMAPDYIAYSPAHHAIYLAGDTGAVRKIDLSVMPLAEEPFVNLPGPPKGLESAGTYIFAVIPTQYSHSHLSYRANGTLADLKEPNWRSDVYTWSPANSKLFFFRRSSNPSNLYSQTMSASGVFGSSWGHNFDVIDDPPIRVSPDGSVVVLGAGQILDAGTLDLLTPTLPAPITDADWTGDGILNSIRTGGSDDTVVEKYRADYTVSAAAGFVGSPLRCFKSGSNHLVLVTQTGDAPSLTVLDAALAPLPPPVLVPPEKVELTLLSPTLARLAWADSSGETAYRVERRVAGGGWSPWAVFDADVNAAEDPSVSAGTVSEYRIVSIYGPQESASSAVVTSLVPLGPGSLDGSNVTGDGVQLTWENVADETGYEIERKHGEDGGWEPAGSVGADLTTSTVPGLQNFEIYCFRVRAINAFGHSAWSPELEVMPADAPPFGAISLSLVNKTATSVELTWTNIDRESGYQVFWRDPPGSFQLAGTTGRDEVTFTVTGLSANTNYRFAVNAVNAAGESALTFGLEVKTHPDTPPAAPAHLNASLITRDRVHLSWQKVDDGWSYELEQKEGAGGSWEHVTTTESHDTTHNVIGLSLETTYTFRVRASNVAGHSDYSPEREVTTLGLPPVPPAGVDASDNAFADRVEITWDPVPDAVTYTIYRNAEDVAIGSPNIGTSSTPAFTDLTATPGVTYYYWVRTTNANGTGGFSIDDTGVRLQVPPDVAPTNVTASSGSDLGGVIVSWDTVFGAEGYRVFRSVTPGAAGTFLGESSGTDFTDDQAGPGEVFHYTVQAINNAGEGPVSGEASGYRGLAAPSGIEASDRYQSRVEVTWEAVSGAESYEIFRSPADSTGTAVRVGTSSELRYDDATAVADRLLYYFVRAAKGSVESGYSESAAGKRFPVPAYQPDALITYRAKKPLGDGIYNGTARRQRWIQTTERQHMYWNVFVENDGHFTDSFQVSGSSGNRYFRISYFTISHGDVTAAIRGGVFRFGELPPGSRRRLIVRMWPERRARGKRKSMTARVRVSSMEEPSRVDTVKAIGRMIR